MVAPIPDEKKREAIRLRVEERLSIDQVVNRTGISKGTVSTILRDYPLSDQETKQRKAESAIRNNHARKYQPTVSKLFELVKGKTLSTDQKGRIAEDAVRLRLVALEYDIFLPPENSPMDFVVTRPNSNKFLRLQVKWARRVAWGRPAIKLTNGEGKKIRPISSKNCDFVVGYDLETDTAFVMPIQVCEGKNAKSCDEQYAEAWHLLGI